MNGASRAEPGPGHTSRRRVADYALALVASVLSIALTVALQPVLPRLTLLLALTAVVVVAWRGGLGPGLAASVLGAVGVLYFVLPPVRSFAGSTTSDLIWLGAFLFVATLVSALAEALHRALDASRQQASVLHERTEALAAALAQVEAANAAKSQFLATMSHELRTPLNAIQGHVQLLEMELYGPVTATQRDALERVQRAQRHLLGLITDILNYAKLESGRVTFDVREAPVEEVLADVLPMIEPQVAAKGIRLFRSGAGGAAVPGGTAAIGLVGGLDGAVAGAPVPLTVWADREKLVQVVLNLLSNAVKFTPSGGSITVDAEAAVDAPDHVLVHVRDTGIGIPADRLRDVFEPFVQVRHGARAPDVTGGAGGTGLGLAISRDLARGMGGELTVESTPGEGSTFTLTLPRA